MKIKLVSDLHLEFSDVDIPNNGCDVLILSGDILIAQDLHDHPRQSWVESKEYLWRGGQMRPEKSDRFRDFLNRCSKNFPHVVYVSGWLHLIIYVKNVVTGQIYISLTRMLRL
jgi:hypothetical protein